MGKKNIIFSHFRANWQKTGPKGLLVNELFRCLFFFLLLLLLLLLLLVFIVDVLCLFVFPSLLAGCGKRLNFSVLTLPR